MVQVGRWGAISEDWDAAQMSRAGRGEAGRH